MSYPSIKYKLSIYIIKLGNTSHNMNKNAKNVIFKVLNVAIYAFVAGKFLKFGKCACVKIMTNMMSVPTILFSVTLCNQNCDFSLIGCHCNALTDR